MVVKSQVTDVALVQRRREQIVTAAVELFATQGFYRTTIQQIARKAGVSTGLIYQYAETKEDVLLLALMHVMDRYRHELEAIDEGSEPLGRLYAALETYCRVVDENRDAAILAYRSTMSLPLEYRHYIKQAELATNELMATRVRACIDAGLFREVDVELVTYQLVMHAHAWSLKYWRLSRIISSRGLRGSRLRPLRSRAGDPQGKLALPALPRDARAKAPAEGARGRALRVREAPGRTRQSA